MKLPELNKGTLLTAAKLLFALSMSVTAGVMFEEWTLPLPWILGPMAITATAAVLRAPIAVPTPIRPYVIAAIGVMLGSAFTPAFLDSLGQWGLSFAFLVLYTVVSAAVVVPYYRYVARFDGPTAWFAGMPGGLSEMMVAGREMGGDDRKIVLAHVSRIIIVVGLVAFWFRGVLGVDLSERPGYGVALLGMPHFDLAVLLGAGVAGFFCGRLLRLPASNLLGPMLFTAVAQIAGWTSFPLPEELSITAQVLLGTIMGGRFIGVAPRMVFTAVGVGMGATVLMLVITFGMAAAIHPLLGQHVEQVILAYSPGGLAEMSIVALAMNTDIVYVSSHHVFRITLIMALAPLAFRLMARMWK